MADAPDPAVLHEQLEGVFVAAIERERASPWTAGDVIRSAMALAMAECHDVRQLPAVRRQVLGRYAHLAGCSLQRIRDLADVAETFPEEERYPDRAWWWYREVREAALRCNATPSSMLVRALDRNYSGAVLERMGKRGPKVARLMRRCVDCKTWVTVKCTGSEDDVGRLSGTMVPCPICVATCWAAGTDGREARKLGMPKPIKL